MPTAIDAPPFDLSTVSVGKVLDTIETDHAVFEFTRSGDTTAALTISFSLGGSAVEGADYVPVSHAVTIAAGYSATMIGIPTKADNLVEGTESVQVTIEPGAYAVGSSPTAAADILDDPATVWIDATPIDLREDGGGEIVVRRLGGDVSEALTASIWVGGGDAGAGATPGVDFTATGPSGSALGWTQITFAAGQDSVSIAVAAVEDNTAEGPESIWVAIGNLAGYVAGAVTAVNFTVADKAAAFVPQPIVADPPPKPANWARQYTPAEWSERQQNDNVIDDATFRKNAIPAVRQAWVGRIAFQSAILAAQKVRVDAYELAWTQAANALTIAQAQGNVAPDGIAKLQAAIVAAEAAYNVAKGIYDIGVAVRGYSVQRVAALDTYTVYLQKVIDRFNLRKGQIDNDARQGNPPSPRVNIILKNGPWAFNYANWNNFSQALDTSGFPDYNQIEG